MTVSKMTKQKPTKPQLTPKNATEAAEKAADEVREAIFYAEAEGRTPKGYDVKLMRAASARTKE